MSVIVKRLAQPSLSEPILLGGVPDSGYVTKLIVEHVIKELKMTPLAEIFSSSLPPRIMINPDGTSQLVRNIIYFSEGGSRDVLLFTGDAQPMTPTGAFEISETALDIGSEFGLERVYTIGAGVTKDYSTPKVFGTGTDEGLVKELEELGVEPMKQGVVTWMNGVLLGLAKVRGLRGAFLCVYCLSSETGYFSDMKSAQLLLQSLSKIIGGEIDPASLAEKVKETWFLINDHDHERESREVKGYRQKGLYG